MAASADSVEVFELRDVRTGFVWDAWKRLKRNRAATISAGVIGVLVLVALFAELVAPYDPYEQFLAESTGAIGDPLTPRETGKFEAPSGSHFFGTDHLARDIFSRTVIGLRISLAAAFFAIVVVTFIGIAVGAMAASGSKFFDDLLMRATDIAYAFPDLLLIILLRAAFGDEIFGQKSLIGMDAGVLLLFLAISLTAWPTTARIVRGQLLSIREMEYSSAARALGASPRGTGCRTRWAP